MFCLHFKILPQKFSSILKSEWLEVGVSYCTHHVGDSVFVGVTSHLPVGIISESSVCRGCSIDHVGVTIL